jgi:hypothetical protein
MSIFPDIHFGDDERPHWLPDDTPDDDAEVFPTPAYVVGMLGFDPREFDNDPEPVKTDATKSRIQTNTTPGLAFQILAARKNEPA